MISEVLERTPQRPLTTEPVRKANFPLEDCAETRPPCHNITPHVSPQDRLTECWQEKQYQAHGRGTHRDKVSNGAKRRFCPRGQEQPRATVPGRSTQPQGWTLLHIALHLLIFCFWFFLLFFCQSISLGLAHSATLRDTVTIPQFNIPNSQLEGLKVSECQYPSQKNLDFGAFQISEFWVSGLPNCKVYGNISNMAGISNISGSKHFR